MAFRVMIFVLVSFLLATAMDSSNDDNFNMEATFAKGPVLPLKAPVPLPTAPPTPVKAPVPAPIKAPVITPSPPKAPVVVKAPPPLPITKPPVVAPRPPIRSKADCFPQCKERCYVHSRKNVCMRACLTCCDRCECVPPGTHGNQAMCGTCYTGMKTHGNMTKCP